MTTVLHFPPDLALVEIENIRSPVQGTDHFSSIYSDGSYVCVSHEVSVEFKIQQALKALGFIEETQQVGIRVSSGIL